MLPDDIKQLEAALAKYELFTRILLNAADRLQTKWDLFEVIVGAGENLEFVLEPHAIGFFVGDPSRPNKLILRNQWGNGIFPSAIQHPGYEELLPESGKYRFDQSLRLATLDLPWQLVVQQMPGTEWQARHSAHFYGYVQFVASLCQAHANLTDGLNRMLDEQQLILQERSSRIFRQLGLAQRCQIQVDSLIAEQSLPGLDDANQATLCALSRAENVWRDLDEAIAGIRPSFIGTGLILEESRMIRISDLLSEKGLNVEYKPSEISSLFVCVRINLVVRALDYFRGLLASWAHDSSNASQVKTVCEFNTGAENSDRTQVSIVIEVDDLSDLFRELLRDISDFSGYAASQFQGVSLLAASSVVHALRKFEVECRVTDSGCGIQMGFETVSN